MFLQQSRMTYWISLLRTALMNNILPITVDEYKRGVHVEFDELLQSRLRTIESLTEHIRSEPPRERGRRKLSPIADVVELVLVLTANDQFESSHGVLTFISTWYDENVRNGTSSLKHDKVFSENRWLTYKYKVRKMAKDILLEHISRHADRGIPHDIWQPSEHINGRVVSLASLAAATVLPDFGYHKVGRFWEHISKPIDPTISNRQWY
jgi:hypothetical protein